MTRANDYENRIDTMLTEHTEEFLWAVANVMARRAHEVEQEGILPRWIEEKMTERYRAVSGAALDFAKMINPNRA